MIEALVRVFDAFDDSSDSAAAERVVMERTAQLETAALLGMLRRLDPDCPQVEFQGKRYRRLRQYASGLYSGLRREIRVQRALYREMELLNFRAEYGDDPVPEGLHGASFCTRMRSSSLRTPLIGNSEVVDEAGF